MKNIREYSLNNSIKSILKEKGLLNILYSSFKLDNELISEIAASYKTNFYFISKLSKKHPDILFEIGDITWFFASYLNGEKLMSLSPIEVGNSIEKRSRISFPGVKEYMDEHYGKHDRILIKA